MDSIFLKKRLTNIESDILAAREKLHLLEGRRLELEYLLSVQNELKNNWDNMDGVYACHNRILNHGLTPENI